MCYVIARFRDGHGCVALKTEHGKHMADFKHSLDEAIRGSEIELVTISRPTAYGEYATYRFVHSEEEFSDAVMEMYHQKMQVKE